MWRVLGRAAAAGGPEPVLVLTSSLPRPNSPADRALLAGAAVLVDVIELYDPEGEGRLATYAAVGPPSADVVAERL